MIASWVTGEQDRLSYLDRVSYPSHRRMALVTSSGRSMVDMCPHFETSTSSLLGMD